MTYQIINYVHVLVLGIFMLHLLVRLSYLFMGKDENLLLYSERSKTLNFLLLSIIVLTGVYLGFNYDFSEGIWFALKILLLAITAFVGNYAFNNFNKLAGVACLLLLAYIIALSYTKSVLLIPVE